MNRTFFDITPPGHDKGFAINWLLEYLHLNEPARTGKRYVVIGLACTVLVLVEVLWTFLVQERLDSLSVSPERP